MTCFRDEIANYLIHCDDNLAKEIITAYFEFRIAEIKEKYR